MKQVDLVFIALLILMLLAGQLFMLKQIDLVISRVTVLENRK